MELNEQFELAVVNSKMLSAKPNNDRMYKSATQQNLNSSNAVWPIKIFC